MDAWNAAAGKPARTSDAARIRATSATAKPTTTAATGHSRYNPLM